MTSQDLKLTASIAGAEETAKKIESIQTAKDGLGGATGAQAEATEKASKAQDKLNASESDFVGLLSQLSPALGSTVDGLLKAAKVAGDVDLAQGGLSKTLGRVATAAKKNSSALALIGAGGAVVAAISLIASAVQRMRKEFEEATKAIKENEAALNEIRGKEAERATAIERISDSRREGGFDADTARRARINADRVGKRFKDLDPSSIDQVLGLLGDKNLSQDDIASAAFLLQSGRLNIDSSRPADVNFRSVESASSRNADAVQKFFTREKTQRNVEENQAVINQANSATGETDALRRFIEARGGPGIDVEKFADLFRAFQDEGGLDAGLSRGKSSTSFQDPLNAFRRGSGSNIAVAPDDIGSAFESTQVISDADVATLRRLFQQEKNLEASQQSRITVNNMQNSRFIGPSAASQRQLITNGESIAAGLER